MNPRENEYLRRVQSAFEQSFRTVDSTTMEGEIVPAVRASFDVTAMSRPTQEGLAVAVESFAFQHGLVATQERDDQRALVFTLRLHSSIAETIEST